MSRDQRARDNWALLHTAELAAQKGAPVAVAFNLVSRALPRGRVVLLLGLTLYKRPPHRAPCSALG